jgi:hypothetical protein
MRLAPCVLAGMLLWGRAAAADSFEHITYTPPAGYRFSEAGGARLHLRDDGGEVGMVALYGGRPFSGAPDAAFAEEWKARVLPGFTGGTPQPQTTAVGDVTAALGVQQGTIQGKNVTVMLVVLVGRGRALSVVGAASSPERLREVQAALGSVAVAGGAAAAPAATPTVGVELDFTAPPGFSLKRDGAGATLTPKGAGCVYGISPPFPSSGDLERDARTAFGSIFAPWRPRYADDKSNRFTRGVSADGWRFASMGGDLQQGAGQVLHGMAMVVPTGAKRITAVWELGDLANCRPDLLPFAQLFHSLRVRGAPSDGGKALRGEMTGTWIHSSGPGSMILVFRPDGTYERALHTSTTLGITETTRTGVKGGRYTLRGSELTLEPDDKSKPREIHRVRVVESKAPVSSGKALLLLGDSGEVEYLRRSDL